MSHSFSGRSAIVTGAGSGMGREVALQLILAGAHVVAVDRDAIGLQTTREAASNPSHLTLLEGDVSDPETAQRAVASAAENGVLSHLAVAAGIVDREDFFASDNSTWRQLFEVNVLGCVYFTRAVAMHMGASQTPGSIVLIASVTAKISSPLVAYSTTKAAVLGFIRSVSPSLADRRIRINSVSPGVIHTAMNDARLSDTATREADQKHIPLGRIGTTNDIAEAVMFLLGDSSSYITGSDLVVDGGYRHSQA